MVNFMIDPGRVSGFPESEADRFRELQNVFMYHQSKNAQKARYYDGHISVASVNLGIALPKGIANLEIGCGWGAKTVDVLAARSMFDGFVGENGEDIPDITRILDDNKFIASYQKAVRDELKYGCAFATLSRSSEGCRIRFHSPETAAALWDGMKGRISCGFAIIDTQADESETAWSPSIVNYYTDNAVYVLTRDGSEWTCETHPHMMGRPLMEPLIWNATNDKPFGRSRLKEPVRRLIDAYVRTLANAAIALEFDTTPQKYLLGVTDEQYDAVTSDKFKQYVGSILTATTNPDTGQNPSFGQLQQGTLTPHIEMLRAIATQFSALTGLTVVDTGVVNDANPTSSDAILAQTQTLVGMAEQLNQGNGDALKVIAEMALAISRDVALSELSDQDRAIMAHFKNPAMPSVSVTADAAIKIASARQGFADTDTFLEMIGFSQSDIRRIRAQEQRARGLSIFEETVNGSEA